MAKLAEKNVQNLLISNGLFFMFIEKDDLENRTAKNSRKNANYVHSKIPVQKESTETKVWRSKNYM